MKEAAIRRFLRYVKVNTQSNEHNEGCPSTEGQWELARMLADELETIGMEDVTVDENGYVMATLPANTEKAVPTIGFLAHMDTSPDLSGEQVNPQIIEAYDGGEITLNEEMRIVLSPREFPELAQYKGQTLITTDGTTLLGADDKAGIAEIMTAMAYLLEHPEIKHGKVRVAFTPDEEIGRGAHRFNVEAFGAKYAYTMDGGPLGELQYESFNAASAFVTFRGKNVHPGTAKGKMIHASKLAIAFHERVPSNESPEHTEGYEGYFHLASFEGDVEQAKLHYLIRDFDRNSFERRKEQLKAICEAINHQSGEEHVEIVFKDRYFNMREKIEPVMGIVEIARQAMENLGIKPNIAPIRGGTDGSQLSYMGLPTPNLFAGGENFHGRYEYISADTMAKAAQVIVEIIRLFEENPVIDSDEVN